jgi:hydantoinase/carbamoylase family amidase
VSLAVDADRVIADLRRLDELTADERGAQRVAWTDTWEAGRRFYADLLAEIGLSPERDEAGNLWTYLPGRSPRFVAVGSHLDSVPDGGWLDGALGVMTGIGLARSLGDSGSELGLALVDFADEEGARFGRSLFGSSAVSGTLEPERVSALTDNGGASLDETLQASGIDLRQAPRAQARLDRLAAYLELHIEQGPILEAEGADIGIVEGVMGIRRSSVTIRGRSGHAGATPMKLRRDPVVAFARAVGEIDRIAREIEGLATIGVVNAAPQVPTIIPETVRFTVDLRHREDQGLRLLDARSQEALAEAGRATGSQVDATSIWEITPTEFDRHLVRRAAELARPHGSLVHLTSGPGHDAAEMARRLPTAMMFAPSARGLSHVADEDTDPDQLKRAIRAFADWVGDALTAAPAGDSARRGGNGRR